MRFILIVVFTLAFASIHALEEAGSDGDQFLQINVEHLNRPEPNEIYHEINWLENTFAVAVNGLLGKNPNIDARKSIFLEFQKFVQILETIKDKLRRAVSIGKEKASGVKEDADQHR